MKAPFALFCDATWIWVGLGMGGTVRVGLSRLELEASARLLGVEMTTSIFDDVRAMEDEAIRYWSRRQKH